MKDRSVDSVKQTTPFVDMMKEQVILNLTITISTLETNFTDRLVVNYCNIVHTSYIP